MLVYRLRLSRRLNPIVNTCPGVDVQGETLLLMHPMLVQVGGFLQRIDYVRKYAFGVMCILKNKEGQFPIK